jgi:hypothetical protein
MRSLDAQWVTFCFAVCACTRTSATSDAPAPEHSEEKIPQAAAVAAASTDRVKVSAELERACIAICQRSRTLKCGNARECQPHCLAMGALTPCSSEIHRFYDCLVPQPIQNWECAADGVAAIRDGFCDKEQSDALACMEAKMAR